MMKKTFITLLVCGIFFAMSSCGSSSCSAEDLTAAAKTLTEAANKYSADPSKANCEAYKTALNKYIDDIKDCDGVSETAVANARETVGKLDCK